MVNMENYWPAVLGIALGTYLIRYSFILIMDKITLPEAFHQMLRFIPASVLTALVIPAVLLHKSGHAGIDNLERPLAALVAIAVAWKTKSILWTIASGMVCLWVLKAVT